MASRKKTGSAEKDETGTAVNPPYPSIRRSKRLQDQSSKAKRTSSKGDSGSITRNRLPSNTVKKPRKAKKALDTVSKQPSRPVNKGSDSKVLLDNRETNLGSHEPVGNAEKENSIATKDKRSHMSTPNKQPPQAPADDSQSYLLSEMARFAHGSDGDVGGQRGHTRPSPKRKLDQTPVRDASNMEPLAKSPKLSSNSHHRSGNMRNVRTLHELSLAGWHIAENISKAICCTDTVDISRLPSPLANLGNNQGRFLNLINSHVPDQVRLLFHEVRNDSSYYRRKIARAFAREAQGVFVEYISGTRPTPAEGFGQRDEDDDSDSNVDTAMHGWPSNAPEFESALGIDHEGASLLPQSTRLEACAFENPEIGHRSQFLVSDYDQLVVNESTIGHNLIAGPLPEFAIIQIDQYTLFWWRTLEALDYLPYQDAPLLAQQESDIGNKEQLAPSSEDWADILDHGLARHRRQRRRRNQPKKGKEPHQINRYRDLEIDSVVLAIASIWDALRKRGVIYAFAGLDVFDPDIAKSGQLSGSGVVGGSRKYIMLLSLPPNSFAQKTALEHWNGNKGKNKNSKIETPGPAVGHIVLAVAEMLSDAGNGVNIVTLDSRNGTFPAPFIHHKAALLVTKSGWLGHCRFGHHRLRLEQWPEDERPQCRGQLVPQQPAGSNACGLFTILYAWAVMLEIPLRNEQRRRGRRSNEEFLRLGQELVNLALAGFMDSRTIQAFMNVFGLSERQDASKFEDEVINRVDASLMNYQKFIETLNLQKHRDAEIPMPSLTPEAEDGTEQERQFPEDDIRLLTIICGQGTTREQVLRALRHTDGNIEDAEAIIQAENQILEPPSNE